MAVIDICRCFTLATLATQYDTNLYHASSHATVETFALLRQKSKNETIQQSHTLMAPQEVIDIYPTTSFQKDVLEMPSTKTQLNLHRIFKYDIDCLRARYQAIIEQFSILQIVFNTFQASHIQIILRHIELPFAVVYVAYDLNTASHTICLTDTQSGFRLARFQWLSCYFKPRIRVMDWPHRFHIPNMTVSAYLC